MSASSNHLFCRAARGEATPRPPIWLMRQAGRTDPEYRRLKAASGLPLEALFRNPELAAEISLLPQRFGVDAIIYFQDILTPLAPMGAEFVFAPGPKLTEPVKGVADLTRLALYDVEAELPFIPETFHRVYESLGGALPVLGFAGAPMTLATFILEGQSFGDRADRALAFFRDEPVSAHRLLDLLTAMTIDYLRLQVRAGAVAVQLFESAAYLLDVHTYKTFALPYQQRIFKALKGEVTTIVFAREWNRIDELDAAGADIISLPSAIGISEAREALGDDRVMQGNLSNRLLCEGDRDTIAAAARACIADGGCRGHIFNLDHGLLRDTPFENVTHLINTVRAWGA